MGIYVGVHIYIIFLGSRREIRRVAAAACSSSLKVHTLHTYKHLLKYSSAQRKQTYVPSPDAPPKYIVIKIHMYLCAPLPLRKRSASFRDGERGYLRQKALGEASRPRRLIRQKRVCVCRIQPPEQKPQPGP